MNKSWLHLIAIAGLIILVHRDAPIAHASAKPAPSLRIIVLTDLEGMLEPCGCLSNPLGGLDRIVKRIDTLVSQGIPSVVIIAGDTFHDPNLVSSADGADAGVAAWKIDALSALISLLPTQICGITPKDVESIVTKTTLCEKSNRNNDLEIKSRTIGDFFSEADIRNKHSKTGLHVAISAAPVWNHGTRIPAIDKDTVLIRSGLGRDTVQFGRPGEDQPFSLSAGRHGEHLVVLDVYGTDTPIHGNRGRTFLKGARFLNTSKIAGGGSIAAYTVDIDRKTEPSKPATLIIEQFNQKVNSYNRSRFENRMPPAPEANDPVYVSSEVCKKCHAKAYTWWQTTPHSRAYESLVKQFQEFHLSCVGCHVTGYERPGGSTVTHVDALKNVGCESCHGPGSEHAKNPKGPLGKLTTRADEALCRTCHTKEHSDRFDFAKYRQKLIVPAHGIHHAPGRL